MCARSKRPMEFFECPDGEFCPIAVQTEPNDSAVSSLFPDSELSTDRAVAEFPVSVPIYDQLDGERDDLSHPGAKK